MTKKISVLSQKGRFSINHSCNFLENDITLKRREVKTTLAFATHCLNAFFPLRHIGRSGAKRTQSVLKEKSLGYPPLLRRPPQLPAP